MTLYQSHEVIEIEPAESVFGGDIPISRFNSEYHDQEQFDSMHSQAKMIKPESPVVPSPEPPKEPEKKDIDPPTKVPVDDEKQEEKPETILLGPFELGLRVRRHLRRLKRL